MSKERKRSVELPVQTLALEFTSPSYQRHEECVDNSGLVGDVWSGEGTPENVVGRFKPTNG